jgi:hypothetical protein
MTAIRRTITFDNIQDADLLAYLDEQPNNSATVRAALREYIHSTRQLDAETVRRIIREELARATISTTETAAPILQDVDPQAGALLDEMF